jgi:hypothetical protein
MKILLFIAVCTFSCCSVFAQKSNEHYDKAVTAFANGNTDKALEETAAEQYPSDDEKALILEYMKRYCN